MKAGFGPDPSLYETSQYPISSNGIIRLAFVAPEDPGVQVLGIEATYRDLSQWFSTVPRSVSSDNKYIQVRLATERPSINGNIQFSVISTEPLSFSQVRRSNYTLFTPIELSTTNSSQAVGNQLASNSKEVSKPLASSFVAVF